MLAIATTNALSFTAPTMRVAPAAARTSGASMDAIEDLKALAKEQNPVVGYYDPLNLAYLNFWGQGDDATVGFLRHAEIKHGRVAMAGFVGFCVQSAGVKFPWEPFASISATAPQAQWDELPMAAKLQIVAFVGFLEVYSEHSFILEKQGEKHYMRGGKPGYFPKNTDWPHPVPLNLYDPFNFSTKMDEPTKARRRNMEVNNGRFAMIGLFGLLSESAVPGSVPFGPHVAPYSGDIMAPFM